MMYYIADLDGKIQKLNRLLSRKTYKPITEMQYITYSTSGKARVYSHEKYRK